MWYIHKEEHEAWMGQLPQYDSDHYFTNYKWMLKAMYKAGVNDQSFFDKILK